MVKHAELEVPAKELRWRCDPKSLGFETTEQIPCCQNIIGQDRALDAIRFGLEITSPGYNIYVSGLTGTGKSTTIQQLLRSMRHETRQLLDLCYVHNFRTPEEPVCICLPAGEGGKFKRMMGEFLHTLEQHVPKVLESEAFGKTQKRTMEGIKNQRGELASELEKLIEEKGFKLLEVQYGPFTRPVVLPVIDSKPIDMDELRALVDENKLSEEDFKRFENDHETLSVKMDEFLKATRALDRELVEKNGALEKEFAGPIVDTCVREVGDGFDNESIRKYLGELREHVIDNLDTFKEEEPDDKKDPQRGLVEFQVNVIVDNSHTDDVPIIIETTPTYRNLFGTIERWSDGRGNSRTDLTMIRAGSMVQANGGFLVLNLNDVIDEPAAWPALKRALKNKEVAIQGLDSMALVPTSALRPEAIAIDVKVVLIGDAESYQFLYQYDEDFRKIFKVKADFDTEMPNTPENVGKYAEFIRSLGDNEGLLPFHNSAVAACAEQGAEIAGRQDRLTTRFSDVADIVREANYWAAKADIDLVKREHVERAVKERIRRVNLSEEKMGEMLTDGTILLDIDGEKIGQVNGLSVYDLGDYSFGKPVRITVETSMGRAGIISIEREAELSGKTYNKGSLILEGYLRRKFAQNRPLAMSASICFEQSYGGVDGDSASSTEIYGLLSSLGEVPLRQDLAVTGSVNQKGEIQPIGGANEKVHGFFDLCKAKGLTGQQGVIIPKLNKVDLMLRNDVVEAIGRGQFHIYAIESIEQGIEILTGMKAGEWTDDDEFEKNSLNNYVDAKLTRYAEQLKDYGETGDEKE